MKTAPEAARPFAPACERNRDPILQVLREHLPAQPHVFEIASGTGQHAVHFTANWPGLRWQCSDLPERLPGVESWLRQGDRAQLPVPLELDALGGRWPSKRFDAVFTANSFHIMPWAGVQATFEAVPDLLKRGGQLIVYGPFRINGEFVADSDVRFDADLRARDAKMGLRELGAVEALAAAAGLVRRAQHAMPANNQCVVWQLDT